MNFLSDVDTTLLSKSLVVSRYAFFVLTSLVQVINFLTTVSLVRFCLSFCGLKYTTICPQVTYPRCSFKVSSYLMKYITLFPLKRPLPPYVNLRFFFKNQCFHFLAYFPLFMRCFRSNYSHVLLSTMAIDQPVRSGGSLTNAATSCCRVGQRFHFSPPCLVSITLQCTVSQFHMMSSSVSCGKIGVWLLQLLLLALSSDVVCGSIYSYSFGFVVGVNPRE